MDHTCLPIPDSQTAAPVRSVTTAVSFHMSNGPSLKSHGAKAIRTRHKLLSLRQKKLHIHTSSHGETLDIGIAILIGLHTLHESAVVVFEVCRSVPHGDSWIRGVVDGWTPNLLFSAHGGRSSRNGHHHTAEDRHDEVGNRGCSENRAYK